MNSYKHYVPVLRWKQAEWIALRELTPDVLRHITPVLEPTPAHFGTNKLGKLDTQIERTVENLQRIKFKNPVFFDTHLISNTGNESYLLKTLFRKINKQKTALIPVVSLESDTQHNVIVRSIIKTYDSGLCLRINIANCDLDKIKIKLDEVCDFFNCHPEQIDLIIDYKLISSENKKPEFKLFCQLIPYLQKWRSFTALSGVFPKYPSEYSVDTHYIKRLDWLMWLNQINTSLQRIPSFGDYTIQHPIFSEPPRGARGSATIRYAIEDDWLLLRGHGLATKNGGGYAQYPAQAQLLVEREEFKGSDFSIGDSYIYDIAERAKQGEKVKTGSSRSWLSAGINHHLTLVVTQISNLDEI